MCRAASLFPALLSEISSHDLEVAETLIGVLRSMLIFVGAKALGDSRPFRAPNDSG